MGNKYLNKYSIGSNRLVNWDYSSNGSYFITLVTQHRHCLLGEIIQSEDNKAVMKLFDFGTIVDEEWQKSFSIREELYLDTYIIMPNHIHAIVTIETETHDRASRLNNSGRTSEQNNSDPASLYRLPKSISSFLAGFKSAVNTKIDNYIDKHQLDIPKYNRNNHFFQPNYHDHIIMNNCSFERIRNYIINNPQKWLANSPPAMQDQRQYNSHKHRPSVQSY